MTVGRQEDMIIEKAFSLVREQDRNCGGDLVIWLFSMAEMHSEAIVPYIQIQQWHPTYVVL